MRRQELRLAKLAGPGADHLGGRKIAAVDHLQRRDGLVLEALAAAAVISQGHQRGQHRQVAHVGAEVAFQSPERGNHGGRHAVVLLGAREGRGVGPDPRLPLLHAEGCRHAAGELGKNLPEHALAAVAIDDALLVDEVGLRLADRLLRHAFGDRALLQLGQEAFEARAIVAGRRARRRRCGRTRRSGGRSGGWCEGLLSRCRERKDQTSRDGRDRSSNSKARG